jgi:putative Ca2+/H+ antiporter (TMEM165/GDT1 family)
MVPMTPWALFASVFGIIFIAELPDKTALAALVLATRHRALPVWLGAAGALTVQSLVAVAAGQLVSLLPPRPVHIVAGVVFVLSGIWMWLRKAEEEEDTPKEGNGGFWASAWVVFSVVFIAEWGDLTQLATAALAARYHSPIVVFSASTLALWSVTGIAVFVGNHAGKMLDPNVTKRIAAVLFAAIGAALIAGLL